MRVDDAITSSLSAPEPSAQSEGTGQEEFLQLLVAQLEHQDPMDPQDSADFVAQLAQFAAVEQSIETNRLLEGLGVEKPEDVLSSYTSLVGREVIAASDHVYLEEGGSPAINVSLDSPAARLDVNVVDASGQLVTTLQLGPQTGTEASVVWDGQSAEGHRLPPGNYHLEAQAISSAGDPIAARTAIRDQVDRVQFENGTAIIHLGSTTVGPNDIRSVGLPTAEQGD